MLSRESRQTHSERRAHRRTDLTNLERLEDRALLAFSPLGFSLPDLTITGEAGPRAAWGGALDVNVTLQNIGASTITEPFSQAPATQAPITGSLYGSSSAADAPVSTVAVYVSRSPKSLRGAVRVGTFQAAPVGQNSIEQLTEQMTLPSHPAGFPGGGGKVFVWFQANSAFQFPETNLANNLSKAVPVMITSQPLPELRHSRWRCRRPCSLATRFNLRSRSRTSGPPTRLPRDRSRSSWWPRSLPASHSEARSSRRSR